MEMMHSVILGFGSNLGSSVNIIENALKELDKNQCKVLLKSSYYQSEAWGYESQNFFINSCAIIKTAKHPIELLDTLKSIEIKLGRTIKSQKNEYSDRTIDIDILFFDNLVLEKNDLIIPHPRLIERNFVLLPLMEIAQDYIHPILKLTVNQLLSNTKDNNNVRLIE